MPEKSILDELQASFPKTAKTDWIQAASSELSGNNPIDSLPWSANTGITFAPYYDQSDRQLLGYQNNFQLKPAENSFNGHRAWSNMPRVTITTDKTANQSARHHLMHGADGILFESPQSTLHLPALLEGIEWTYCTISFFAAQQSALAQDILKYCHGKSYNSKQIAGAIFWQTEATLQPDIVKAFQIFENFKPLGILTATEALPTQELATCLLRGAQLFEKYLDQGIDKEIIAHAIAFSVSIGTDFLTGIAKLKALRLLWYQIAKAYQCKTFEPHHLHLHVRSEVFSSEALQPHSNMLKSTTASIAAVCGGCNALTVYEEQPENPLMQRMARNTAALLREESHFDKVADPTAGAFAIDAITHAMAQQAWQEFQKLTT
jgi:methylmalonyl-CoA mutase